jgi:hypothetical protein
LCRITIHKIRMYHNSCFGKIASHLGHLLYSNISINFNKRSEATSNPPETAIQPDAFKVNTNLR